MLSRRDLIRLGSIAGPIALLQACAPAAPSSVLPTPPPAAPPTPAPTPAPAAQPTTASAVPKPTTGAASAAPPSTARTPTGTIVYGSIPDNSRVYDPGTASSVGTKYWPMYDSMTWMDGTGEVKPGLAKSWKNVDESTWEFHLGDYKFHNGRAVAAQDVVDSIKRLQDPANKLSAAIYVGSVASAEARDPKTVRITTKAPDPALPNVLSAAYILPMQELNAQGPDVFFKSPIGTGPFKTTQIDFPNSLKFTAMGADWVTPQGVPHVKDLEFRYVPDFSTQLAALKAGDLDIISPFPDAIPELEKAGFKITVVEATNTTHYVIDTTTAPLDDVRVRQALNYAVDKEAINKALFGPHAPVDGQLIGPNALGYDPNITPYAYDPNKAKQLLADAGVTGLTIPITASTSTQSRKEVAEAVAQYLSDVGVKSNITVVDIPTLYAMHLGGTDRRPGLYIEGMEYATTYEAGSPWRWFTSELPADGGRRWFDDTFDRLYHVAKATFDRDQRAQAYRTAGRYLHDQAPVLFLNRITSYYASKPNVDPGITSGMGTAQSQYVNVTGSG